MLSGKGMILPGGSGASEMCRKNLASNDGKSLATVRNRGWWARLSRVAKPSIRAFAARPGAAPVF
jgi:hypothetical protein